MKANNDRATGVMHTPLGWIGVAVTEQGISRVVLPKKGRQGVVNELRAADDASANGEKLFRAAAQQLREYIAGKLESFDLPLDLQSHTPFQRAVWRAAAAVPYGETRSYAWIAKRIKRPKAARAVGQALGGNPIPLLIP